MREIRLTLTEEQQRKRVERQRETCAGCGRPCDMHYALANDCTGPVRTGVSQVLGLLLAPFARKA